MSTTYAQLEIRENGSAIVGERCNENYSTGLGGGDNRKGPPIRIYDLQGKQLMRLDVEGRGDTDVVVEAAALMPGMYIYALICDGMEIDSKRMIVTE